MPGIKKFIADKEHIEFECHSCGHIYTIDVSGFVPQFLPEFNHYENIPSTCPNCSSVNVININIPESEYEEIEFEDTVMPLDEIDRRKQLRDLMWKKRPDLRGKDRAAFNQEKKQILEDWRQTQKDLKQQEAQQKAGERHVKGIETGLLTVGNKKQKGQITWK